MKFCFVFFLPPFLAQRMVELSESVVLWPLSAIFIIQWQQILSSAGAILKLWLFCLGQMDKNQSYSFQLNGYFSYAALYFSHIFTVSASKSHPQPILILEIEFSFVLVLAILEI